MKGVWPTSLLIWGAEGYKQVSRIESWKLILLVNIKFGGESGVNGRSGVECSSEACCAGRPAIRKNLPLAKLSMIHRSGR